MAKMAIFGCFWPIMGLFLIEYEGFGPKTCTKYVGILGVLTKSKPKAGSSDKMQDSHLNLYIPSNIFNLVS